MIGLLKGGTCLKSVQGVYPLIWQLVVHLAPYQIVGVIGDFDRGDDEQGGSSADDVAIGFPAKAAVEESR